MYVTPQPHKCDTCGHKMNYSPHDSHPAPTTLNNEPFCPVCYDKFLRKHVGVMDNLTFPRKK